LPELEGELRALAASVYFPPERDFVPPVRARLAPQPRRAVPWRRFAAAAAIVLVVGLATAMAVPDARAAILDFLGLRSVTVIRVNELPPAGPGTFEYSDRVTLAQAEELVGFRPLLPDVGPPDAVRVSRFAPDIVVIVYGGPRARLRLTELHYGAIEKFALTEQRVERVEVRGQPGLWIEGRHVVELQGLPRLAGNTLLWEQDGLTLRLEGRLSRDQALEIARSTR